MKLSPIQKLKQRNIIRYIKIGAVIGLITGFIFSYLAPGEFPAIVIRSIIVSVLIAFFLSSFEVFIYPKYLRKKTFFFSFLVRMFFYTSIVAISLLGINIWNIIYIYDLSFIDGIWHYILDDSFLRDFLYGLIVAIIVVVFIQLSRLLSKGVLLNYFTGKYHHPTEIERIFLFVDLKSSTTMGDRMGNIKFSAFLKDYFIDITEALLLTKADIYMYEGDGVILSWPMELGLKNANCVQCFFYMQDTFEKLKDKYQKTYGTYPIFKAGLHGGKVIVTWLGELKREIVYHGDVLNTTSRIQGECNRLQSNFLVSESLLKKLNLADNIKSTFQEELLLRGKLNRVRIHGLEVVE